MEKIPQANHLIYNISGIYRDKTMTYKLMYILNDDTPSVDYSWCLKLNKPTNQNSTTVPKDVKPKNKKTLL